MRARRAEAVNNSMEIA